jgi:ribosomal protein S18 acetylase RimI-like enzyme
MSFAMAQEGAAVSVDRARIEDADELLRLYVSIYGAHYPLAFGTNRQVMLETMRSESVLWLVARAETEEGGDSAGKAVASVVFEIDALSKIAKVAGLVVDPAYRKQKLASKLIAQGTRELLEGPAPVNSVYTTTRTNSIGVQLIFLREGFLPLGIFPNAHKLGRYETLTLFAKFREGVIERRKQVDVVPARLGPLLGILSGEHGIATDAWLQPESRKPETMGDPLEFEFVDAPEFVRRKFFADISNPYDRFYPFHVPNLLMVSKDGSAEIYAYFSKSDRYCAITSLNLPVHALAGRMGKLFDQLKEMGVAYLELLMGLEHGRSIEAALQVGFLPSALYPAMLEDERGATHDFVVLSRTLEMLDFRGMEVDRAFKPYIDQYVALWKAHHLESLEVFSQGAR